MSGVDDILAGRASELRRAFDESFAAPRETETRATAPFISLRLGADTYAVRMSDIAGLFTGVKVSPCPSPIAELRGLAGFRGQLTPVYDLSALLGYAPSAGRWAVLAADRALALAFDEFTGHFRLEPADVAAEPGQATARHVREIARHAAAQLPVIDIPSVVAVIHARAAALTSQKEH